MYKKDEVKSISLDNSRTVGQATHELKLTKALADSAGLLFPPGKGRILIQIPEAPIGRGRPDLLLVVVSKQSLQSFIDSEFRVSTISKARALCSSFTECRHESATAASDNLLSAQILHFTEAVFDSIAIEAKMKDWKQAIRQASRFRNLAHRAAIMLPEANVLERAKPFLDSYELGYISVSKTKPVWNANPPKKKITPSSALWLLELAARSMN